MKKYYYSSRLEKHLSKDFKKLRTKIDKVAMGFLINNQRILFDNFDLENRRKVSKAYAEFLIITEEVGLLEPASVNEINRLRNHIVDNLLSGHYHSLLCSVSSYEIILKTTLERVADFKDYKRKIDKANCLSKNQGIIDKIKESVASNEAKKYKDKLIKDSIVKLDKLYNKLNRCSEDKVYKLLHQIKQQQRIVNELCDDVLEHEVTESNVFLNSENNDDNTWSSIPF